VFRIRIHYMQIRIQAFRRMRIRILIHPIQDPDPNPSLKFVNFFPCEFFFSPSNKDTSKQFIQMSLSKICFYTVYQVNFLRWIFCLLAHFFPQFWLILHLLDPDPGSQSNADPMRIGKTGKNSAQKNSRFLRDQRLKNCGFFSPYSA
jgi:hypothetical protein